MVQAVCSRAHRRELTACYAQNQRWMHEYLFRLCQRARIRFHGYDDIEQDLWLAVCRRWAKLRKKENLGACLNTMVHSQVLETIKGISGSSQWTQQRRSQGYATDRVTLVRRYGQAEKCGVPMTSKFSDDRLARMMRAGLL